MLAIIIHSSISDKVYSIYRLSHPMRPLHSPDLATLAREAPVCLGDKIARNLDIMTQAQPSGLLLDNL